MALDGIFIHSIIEELKRCLINGRVDKINQPEKDEIILSIKNERKTYKLLISSSSVYPKIHLTKIAKQNPMQPPMFCMVLRKHLNTGRIVNIRQLGTDRVVFIDFESSDELGFNSIYTLIIEIMGKHSNISLVRERDNVTMDSIKHITPEINTVRSLYPGIKYTFPPSSPKLNPFNYTKEDFISYIKENNLRLDNNFFSKIFTGVSSQFSKEILYRLNTVDAFTEENLDFIFEFSKEIFNKIESNQFFFGSYSIEGIIKDFYCEKLNYLKDYTVKVFSSPSELLEDFYYEKDKADRLNNKSADLQKLVNINLDRCYKKVHILEDTLKDCQNKDKYKLYGELLTANIYSLKKGDTSASVQNYYSEDLECITIKLDKDKTPTDNIQHYFKKYNKFKKAEESAKVQLELTEQEIDYLSSVLTNIKNAEDYESIEEIKRELMETSYIKFKKTSNKKPKPSKPMKFISSDGIEIYVGKNNFQNDYLTLKFADKRDLWMHTKNIPGSHVIVKNFGNIPNRTLEEAALLAAFYSKAKDSTKVPVDYTEIKNVHKPSGSKPGMVIYYTNKTIYVNPEKPQLEQIN
ncbi:NFACT RNA binding domain-containing protein [Clostridium sp. A1-XYC3]|uniref:Rqc2 homolog RqcH n=1 Tax=Clostridium tanneri TaxID=3037988 RepID=A0ABU4JN91_9CLOT|nr:NFACT RNA binding domain-containing protein [Clostridium sp. A1-XYC3]MDW8799606.1 NFACT RNA binding domain-containing protein [Clostridium sp. A1-XYC3]